MWLRNIALTDVLDLGMKSCSKPIDHYRESKGTIIEAFHFNNPAARPRPEWKGKLTCCLLATELHKQEEMVHVPALPCVMKNECSDVFHPFPLLKEPICMARNLHDQI